MIFPIILKVRLIDFEVTEKCTNEACGDKAHDFKDNGNCKFGNFHGSSSSMETHKSMDTLRISVMGMLKFLRT